MLALGCQTEGEGQLNMPSCYGRRRWLLRQAAFQHKIAAIGQDWLGGSELAQRLRADVIPIGSALQRGADSIPRAGCP